MKNLKQISSLALLAVLIAFSNSIQARVWRVNVLSNYNLASQIYGDNYGGTATNPVFNSIASAQSSSLTNNNDTLYLEGCPVGSNHAGVALVRPFVIIGTGYFLSLNVNTSYDLLESRIANLVFNAGSEGSQVIGLNFSSGYDENINVSNITIKRCYFNPATEITIAQNVSNITIAQNFFDNTTYTSSAITFSGYGAPGNNVVIKNNIFKRPLLVMSGSTTYAISKCDNNTFDCPAITGAPSIKMLCSSFKNNIIKNSALTVNINNGIASAQVSYNTIASPTQLDTAAAWNNKYVTNMSNLFVNPTASTDGNYRLKSAAGVNYPGNDGAPRGAYGGSVISSRYTLSGNASIPVVYDITTTGVATQSGGLQVTIKARAIN